MYPKTHFLFALLIAEVLVAFGLLSHALAFAAAFLAVLIDIDHYFVFFRKKKKLGFRAFWNYTAESDDRDQRAFIHHWPGFAAALLISAALFLVNTAAFLVFSVSYFSHMLLDYLPRTKRKKQRMRVFGFVMLMSVYEIMFVFALVVLLLLVNFL